MKQNKSSRIKKKVTQKKISAADQRRIQAMRDFLQAVAIASAKINFNNSKNNSYE